MHAAYTQPIKGGKGKLPPPPRLHHKSKVVAIEQLDNVVVSPTIIMCVVNIKFCDDLPDLRFSLHWLLGNLVARNSKTTWSKDL
jgi:hypothetical protein